MNPGPLKFNPIYKDKIWGGNKIKTILNKDFGNLPNCGESWEISGVPGNVSVVKEGEFQGTLLSGMVEKFKDKLVGKHNFGKYGNEFPLLIKFIDANDDLSIQVHPDDILAAERHKSRGKTEMWYVLRAEPGAKLISGFNQVLDKAKYLEYFDKGELMQLLNIEKVADDDVFFIPAGRVHNIGKGLFLTEIQQTSDITYRIFDFDRVDSQGNKRELHTREAIDAIDFKFYGEYKTNYNKKVVNEILCLADSRFFTTNKVVFNQAVSRDYSALDSFVILICLWGTGTIQFDKGEINIWPGEVVLIPACIHNIRIEMKNNIALLEIYIHP